MLIGDANLLIFFFFFILSSVIINSNTSLHLLLTAELLWITLYLLALTIGLSHDNTNIISLTFFFLVLSAVEFGLGLVLMLLQNIISRSINLNENDSNFIKFLTRFKLNQFSSRLNW